ncbi:hypothetical protein R3P38DRAFT_2697106 [Favolaschia claudopus]|uniref:DUF6535 domain-containing protein n=1 Tax=Favolaschia claudopus TaxID=2862362 RepID=A0AAW0CI08_9AGAR
MEGMLIFAGLFSAVLTAFLIESYKTLNPDPDDLTILLLTRISEQIAASANGNASNIPPPLELNDGGPTRAALACNALWFLSLGLSLSCALIATLLEQWAREFLHRTDIHSAPVIRARIFSFLYYGLRRFNMHAVVDIIPLLLHLSLLLFFSGLVAFLAPVNTGIAIIAAIMLFVIATTYSVLTVFPLRYLDSPYRTPLTGMFWKLFQYFKIRWNPSRHPSPPWLADEAGHSETAGETMVVAISRVATTRSEERASRDLNALVWTMKSLADDTELEPFVDAISDILWGPDGWRETHYALLHNLVNNPQTLLHERIIDLYHSCHTGILTPVALKRRKIICSKALWATVSLLGAPDVIFRKQRKYAAGIRALYAFEQDLEVLHYACSVKAIAQWREFESVKLVLNAHLEYLQARQAMSGGVGAVDLNHIKRYIRELEQSRSYFYLSRQPPNFDYGTSLDHQISTLVGNIQRILTTTPHLILFRYLRSASTLNTLPYCFARTVYFLRPTGYDTPPTIRSNLDITFDGVVQRLLENFNSAEPGWMDLITKELTLSWTRQGNSSNELTLHPALLRYLNNRRSRVAVSTAINPTNFTNAFNFWETLANTLESTAATQDELRDSLTAAWRVMSFDVVPDESLISRLLDDCMRLDISSVTPSLIAALKSSYIPAVGRLYVTNPGSASGLHRWLATIAISSSAVSDVTSSAVACECTTDHPLIVGDGDASVVIFAEYLEICARSTADLEFPHEAMSTLHLMDQTLLRSPQIHATHQLRFAHALRDFFESPACEHMRFTIISNTWLFRGYLDPQRRGTVRWLDAPTARDSVVSTLTQFVEEMTASAEPNADQVVLQTRTVLAAMTSSSQNEGN